MLPAADSTRFIARDEKRKSLYAKFHGEEKGALAVHTACRMRRRGKVGKLCH